MGVFTFFKIVQIVPNQAKHHIFPWEFQNFQRSYFQNIYQPLVFFAILTRFKPASFWYPLKKSENLWFSDVFREIKRDYLEEMREFIFSWRNQIPILQLKFSWQNQSPCRRKNSLIKNESGFWKNPPKVCSFSTFK